MRSMHQQVAKADLKTKAMGATDLMGRKQRPCGISVVASSHMTTPKLKISAFASHGKPRSTCRECQR